MGINVSPGDLIRVEVWACDSNSNLNYNGGYGCYWVYDFNGGTVSQTKLGQINPFVGRSAEFIAEDNSPNNACNASGTYTKFSSVLNSHVDAYDRNFHQHTWKTDSGYQKILNANSSNQLLGFASIDANGDDMNLVWIQGS